jgi:hypothetical protein
MIQTGEAPLRRVILLAAVLVASLCSAAGADEKYLIHEKVHEGDKLLVEMTNNGHFKTISTASGQSITNEQHVKQFLKATMTILTVKDGSATAARVEVDPSSYDIDKEGEQPEEKTSCWYAGKTVTLRRAPDEKVSNDAKGHLPESREIDQQNLNDLLSPDQDMFSDQPVAVGDSWEVSDKLSKHSDLNDGDKLLAHCKLDWVKTINGKQMAELTCVCGLIRYEEHNVEEDDEYTSVMLVDVAAGQIVKADNQGTVKFSTPLDEATQVTGDGEFSGHCEVLPPTSGPRPATQPQP